MDYNMQLNKIGQNKNESKNSLMSGILTSYIVIDKETYIPHVNLPACKFSKPIVLIKRLVSVLKQV